jgi:hypothetical protein
MQIKPNPFSEKAFTDYIAMMPAFLQRYFRRELGVRRLHVAIKTLTITYVDVNFIAIESIQHATCLTTLILNSNFLLSKCDSISDAVKLNNAIVDTLCSLIF